MSNLSGSTWWYSQSLTSQNLGENVETGEGGQSLREAWVTNTGNYDNQVWAQAGDTYSQFHSSENCVIVVNVKSCLFFKHENKQLLYSYCSINYLIPLML